MVWTTGYSEILKISKFVPKIKSSILVFAVVVGEGVIRVLHVDDDEGFLECSKELLLLQGDFEVTDAIGVDEKEKVFLKD